MRLNRFAVMFRQRVGASERKYRLQLAEKPAQPQANGYGKPALITPAAKPWPLHVWWLWRLRNRLSQLDLQIEELWVLEDAEQHRAWVSADRIIYRAAPVLTTRWHLLGQVTVLRHMTHELSADPLGYSVSSRLLDNGHVEVALRCRTIAAGQVTTRYEQQSSYNPHDEVAQLAAAEKYQQLAERVAQHNEQESEQVRVKAEQFGRAPGQAALAKRAAQTAAAEQAQAQHFADRLAADHEQLLAARDARLVAEAAKAETEKTAQAAETARRDLAWQTRHQEFFNAQAKAEQ